MTLDTQRPELSPDTADATSLSGSSLRLLARARRGDRSALDALVVRNEGPLRRWARGKLPQWLRRISDTADLVQDTLFQTFQRLDRLDARQEGALQAYLRQAVKNRIRDEFRRAKSRPIATELVDMVDEGQRSPLDEAISQEMLARYRAALARLKPDAQEAIVGRVELGYSYEQLALTLGKRTPDAARMAVARALTQLAEEMGSGR